jgi:putrescine transport system ATP-binding protein
VALAVRPEKISLWRERPAAANCFPGVVKDLGYFGKDSLFRVALTSGALVKVNSVNATRGEEAGGVGWGDPVWISFPPSAAIVLKD